MTSRKMPLLVLIYIITCCLINTFVNSKNFDSNVFIFWSKQELSPKQRVNVNNFFCMGIVLHIKWILTPRVCFENIIQLTQPETFSVVSMLNRYKFDERKVESSRIFEVEHVLLNASLNTDSGFAILKLKGENLLAKNITKFVSSTKLEKKDKCKSLMWERDSNNKYILQARMYNASKSESCQTLGIGSVCATSNITGKLCKPVRSSLLQCNNKIQGISGYKFNTNVICKRPHMELPVLYDDFSEHILHILFFLLSDKGNEASCLSCSKVLILTTVIISTYRLIKKAV